MKYYMLFGIAVLFFACDKMPGVSNIAGTPESSTYSEKNGLLVERYTYPMDTLEIQGKPYVVADAWISHNFKKSNSKVVNFDYLKFFCSFKNIEDNSYCCLIKTSDDIFEIITNNINTNHGFSGLGKQFSHYDFSIESKTNLPDTVKIFVKDGAKTQILDFYRYSSLYAKTK